jgi:hypothetical protein
MPYSIVTYLNRFSVNPNGLFMIAVGPVFLAIIPVTNYLTAPNSFVQKAIEGLLSVIPGSSSIASNRVIPALSAFYIFWTFAATGAASAAGLGASRKEGLDNNRTYHRHCAAFRTSMDTGKSLIFVWSEIFWSNWLISQQDPRKDVAALKGLPLRLRSAHYNTLEMFPVLLPPFAFTLSSLLTGQRALHSLLL